MLGVIGEESDLQIPVIARNQIFVSCKWMTALFWHGVNVSTRFTTRYAAMNAVTEPSAVRSWQRGTWVADVKNK
jgi:hypothetical protein